MKLNNKQKRNTKKIRHVIHTGNQMAGWRNVQNQNFIWRDHRLKEKKNETQNSQRKRTSHYRQFFNKCKVCVWAKKRGNDFVGKKAWLRFAKGLLGQKKCERHRLHPKKWY